MTKSSVFSVLMVLTLASAAANAQPVSECSLEKAKQIVLDRIAQTRDLDGTPAGFTQIEGSATGIASPKNPKTEFPHWPTIWDQKVVFTGVRLIKGKARRFVGSALVDDTCELKNYGFGLVNTAFQPLGL